MRDALANLGAAVADAEVRLDNPGSEGIEPLVDRIQSLANGLRGTRGRKLPRVVRWSPFPTDLLPEPCRAFVCEGARAMGCDPTYLVLPLLAALGGAIGNKRRILIKRGWSEPSVIWAAIIGRSGTIKSPAQEFVLCPLREWERDLIEAYKSAMATFDRDTEAWKEGKKGERGPRPEPPKSKRFFISDITVEALAVRLEANPRGLLLSRDELAGWIRSFDRYRDGKGGDAQAWLEVFRAAPLIVDRKGSGPKDAGVVISVPRASVSITGTIQPGILRKVAAAEHVQNGLLARLLVAMPPERKKSWTDAEVPGRLVEEVAELFKELLDLGFAGDARGASIPLDLRTGPEAKALFVEFYERHADLQAAAQTEDLAAAYAKLEAYAARFALIFHLVGKGRGQETAPIGPDAMSAGIGVAEWFAHETERVYAALSENDEERARRQLIEIIQDHDDRITVRELMQASRRYRESAPVVRTALDALVAAGLGTWERKGPGPKGGQPTDEFVLGEVTEDGTVTVTTEPCTTNGAGGSVTVTTPKLLEGGETQGDEVRE